MNISWSLRKLAKKADRMAEARLSDREVDKTTNQLSIVWRLTLYRAWVDILFEVLFERGFHRFAFSLAEQVGDVLSLGDHDVGWRLNYLDAKEVMELFQVYHLEFAGEEELDLVDVDWMLSSYD